MWTSIRVMPTLTGARRTLQGGTYDSFGSVAAARAGVVEELTRDRSEVPVVGRRMESELEHAERRAVVDHAGRLDAVRVDVVDVAAAGADDELLDAVRFVRHAHRRLRQEALVEVRVPCEHHVAAVLVERRPHGPEGVAEGGSVELARVGGEQGVVHEHELALVRVCRHVGTQPLLLWAAGSTARGARAAAVGVHRVDPPAADVEGVIPAAPGAGATGHVAPAVEVVEVPARVRAWVAGHLYVAGRGGRAAERRAVLVVADRRVELRLQAAPGRL